MKTLKPLTLLLAGGISMLALTGCEQLEQKAADMVEQTKQNAAQTLDEIRQAGSIEEAAQTATDAFQKSKDGLLNEVQDLIQGESVSQKNEQASKENAATDF